ncbi:PIR Superfamily Protein [Plasmodium ovale wallikeri]|uniref:PIR Superfamily Protein n=1 Tax=Plasmodium ovale wallikeri TaxID=864142 RepID=A0A1A9AQ92_PLAOA|nr:PIR Superfamily Protein [Plasmodium ovale wallikeri]SBT59376.1 PIR Superfamily Protein [Plasmodium ovale wallikeri]
MTLLSYNNTFSENETLRDIYSKFEDMCSKVNNRTYCLIDKDPYSECSNVKKLYYNLNGNNTKYELSDDEFTALYDHPIKFCNYLKYWLYDEIIFNKFDNNQIKEVLNTLKKGDKFQIIIDNYNTCNFDILELDKIKQIKLFYDYIATYDAEKKKSRIRDKICGSSYEETLNRMIDLYNDRNIKGEKESTEYSNEFDECKKTYSVGRLCKLQCVADGFSSLHETQTGCSEVDSSVQHSSAAESPAGKLIHDPTPVRGENTSVGITVTVIPILVTFLAIFPILYKLTPFRTWLHKSIMKTKNFLGIPNENSTDILLNQISDSDNENLMKRSHYIAYNSF